ncbi:transglycosylase SLT domain-containing protein [Acuticoccus mangrovi]|uniref:Transglycosylase SLT domain-containing protein n=1 Tax=Acuticoccus mangrovi TaxID=2796142 RepID=A0A934IQH6_9HYPH|nr:transglycosylase SLT domain-containing protein [Acuticoccus mangrovi]MBJ3776753.1 transglycosylase SLT domain-containing protein [Acuticoccus mangrovi]
MCTRWLTLPGIVAGLLLLAGCGSTPPTSINDVCSVFSQRSGMFDNWYADAKKAERKYGIPVHILMATMRVESGFQGNARPPRRKVMGFIPGKRQSTAYGYSQALNGTWAQYRKETGQSMARRGDFGSSVDFVGWYYAKTINLYGVPRDDAYSLYLSYRTGWSGYGRGSWQDDAGIRRTAARTANFAQSYQAQLADCRL